MRPIVGVTAYVEPARWGGHELVAALVPHRYVTAVEAAGGSPVLLPPEAEDNAPALVARLDGLVLTGGADIDPARYGAPAHPATTGLRPRRDASELALAGAALTQDVPVLGICRGMQLLVVACGGTLHQHLPDLLGHERHRPGGGFGEHEVRFAPGSRIARILPTPVRVASRHHQGIAELGTARASGWADDGSVEVVELPGRFALGVLWHPEVGHPDVGQPDGNDPAGAHGGEDVDLRLFAALVEAAAERAARRDARPVPVRRPGGRAGPRPPRAPRPTPR